MKKNNNIIILGSDIIGLYTGIKYIDLGYNVTILNRVNKINKQKNSNIFNNKHKYYIDLLKRFNINYDSINIKTDNEIYIIINNIIDKTKYLPNNILSSHSFYNISKQILNKYEFNNFLDKSKDFLEIFKIMNVIDIINFLNNDLNANNSYYYIDNNNIIELINKMTSYFKKKKGIIISNIDIKNITYINKKFILYSLNKTFVSDILITTISKKNILNFNFWNIEQKSILNNTQLIDVDIFTNIFNKIFMDYNNNLINNDDNRNYILKDFHIVYPIHKQNNYISIWNYGNNNILLREKIKNLYNKFFYICSPSYSSNNLFINYSLELVDNISNKPSLYI